MIDKEIDKLCEHIEIQMDRLRCSNNVFIWQAYNDYLPKFRQFLYALVDRSLPLPNGVSLYYVNAIKKDLFNLLLIYSYENITVLLNGNNVKTFYYKFITISLPPLPTLSPLLPLSHLYPLKPTNNKLPKGDN